MEVTDLTASFRTGTGKGNSRRLRREGLIPAVFYGPGAETVLLEVNATELRKLRKKAENAFIRLIVTDQEKQVEKLSILKELQIEPLSREFVHADFYEVTLGHEAHFDLPIHFTGEPAGVKEGGELHLLKREIKVSCLPKNRPEFITADVSAMKIGESLKLHDLVLGEGITILEHDHDAVLATVSAVKGSTSSGEAETTAENPS